MLHGPRCPPSQSAVAGAKWTSRSSVGLLGQHEAAPRLLTDACGADRCTTGAGSYPLASKDTDVLLPSHHLFPLRPVVNGRCVQPRLAPGAAAHRHGRQTWPNGRAAAHARFPHTRRLMETMVRVPLSRVTGNRGSPSGTQVAYLGGWEHTLDMASTSMDRSSTPTTGLPVTSERRRAVCVDSVTVELPIW